MLDHDLEGEKAFKLVRDCSLIRTYRDAFQAATGLPLQIVRTGCLQAGKCTPSHANEFCKTLHETGNCNHCIDINLKLEREGKDGPVTLDCFAAMKETVVPINHCGRPIAFLKTGEVLTHRPNDSDFEHIAGVLIGEGRSGAEISLLREAYFDCPVIEGKRYSGIVALLSTFGRQLNEHLQELVIAHTDEIPLPVRKSMEYIERHLDTRLALDDVAGHAGLSVSQFCKVFKESTDTTFTEYANRRRIVWARRELLRPGARVTEVAYKVGFTSLSQFNRCFLRFAGEAPREFRKRRMLEVG